jgi:predicted aldo/keto reductase-like oxidoreductase
MYYNNYSGSESRQMARSLYSQIPQSYRQAMTGFDYSGAEAVCPQGVKIASVIEEAAVKLARA